jgi:hypothetical protein
MRLQVDEATNLGLYCPPFSVDLSPSQTVSSGSLGLLVAVHRRGIN